MGRRRLLTQSHPPAGGDTGTSGSVADKIEDVKSTNGDTRKGGATIVCRRQVSAAGDSRPLASCDTGRDGSATGGKVQNVPASGGKTKQIQAFGCRIRCAIDKEAEMRKYITISITRKMLIAVSISFSPFFIRSPMRLTKSPYPPLSPIHPPKPLHP